MQRSLLSKLLSFKFINFFLVKNHSFLKIINIIFFICLTYKFANSIFEHKKERINKIESYQLKYLANRLIEFNHKCGFFPDNLSILQAKDHCPSFSLEYWDFVDLFAQPIFYKKEPAFVYLAFHANTTFYKTDKDLRFNPLPIKIELSSQAISEVKDKETLALLKNNFAFLEKTLDKE